MPFCPQEYNSEMVSKFFADRTMHARCLSIRSINAPTGFCLVFWTLGVEDLVAYYACFGVLARVEFFVTCIENDRVVYMFHN